VPVHTYIVLLEFDKLVKQVSKSSAGLHTVEVPKVYIKCLADLEDTLADALQKEKEAKRKMNALQAKALTAMKQKLRKNNKQYEEALVAWRQVTINLCIFSFHIPTFFVRIR